MVDTDSIRNKINERVFNNLGSTCLYSAFLSASSITDSYGDRVDVYDTATSVVTVPWGLLYGNQEHFQFGDLEAGEVDMAFKYDQVLNVNDKLSYNNNIYKVKVIEHYIIKDAIIVKVARLKEFI